MTKPVYYFGFIFLAILPALILFSCKREINEVVFSDEENMTLADYIIENKETYSKFWKVIEVGDLVHALSSYNPHGNGYTLFLPTDDAFDRFIENSRRYTSFDDFMKDSDYLVELGRYHLVNAMFRTSEFPIGALPDTTVTGEFLTIAFIPGEDSTTYKVNNVAPVTVKNIELVNGYIHVISEVLEPVIYSSYDWLSTVGGFSILAGALQATGLEDTLGIYKYNSRKQLVKNRYTVLAEHDTLFIRNGIKDFQDLVDSYATPGLEYSDPDNGLYQFAAYHVVEGSYFLDEFTGARNYNTLGSYPVYINASGIDIQINIGVDIFGYIIKGADTTDINYLGFHYEQSNILTKSGAIHLLTEVMKPFKPARSTQYFQFYEEEEIYLASKQASTYEFVDPDKFTVLIWDGPDKIEYIKSTSADEKANNKDYIEIEGRFDIHYTMPKILPGRYEVSIRCNAFNSNNATLQVYLDGNRKGGNIDLTTGGVSNNPYKDFTVGSVEFTKYKEHTVTITSLIPGVMIWDNVKFTPE